MNPSQEIADYSDNPKYRRSRDTLWVFILLLSCALSFSLGLGAGLFYWMHAHDSPLGWTVYR